MDLLSFTAAVLVLNLVITHDKTVTEGKYVVEPRFSEQVNFMRRQDSFRKRDDPVRKTFCGRIKVNVHHISRGNFSYNDDNSYDDTNQDLDKIFGGTFTTYGEIPWQAEILFKGQYLCAAAIVSEYWVISAAHCFEITDPQFYRIVVGTSNALAQDPVERNYNVEKIIKHEMFGKKEPADHDIALVKIAAKSGGGGIQFNDYVQPVCLPESSEHPEAGTDMIISGMGITSPDFYSSVILKKAVQPLLSKESCSQMINDITDYEICTGYYEFDSEACWGDDGAPITYKSDTAAFVLHGIVSGIGRVCGPPVFASIGTSIPAFRSWIDNTINANSKGSEGILPERSFLPYY